MSDGGRRIIESLQQAIDGKFARVTMQDGSVWIPEPQWRAIETAPLNKQILMWAATDVADNGAIKNWKLDAGYIIDQSQHGGSAREYSWPHRLAIYEIEPTHWQPIPNVPDAA